MVLSLLSLLMENFIFKKLTNNKYMTLKQEANQIYETLSRYNLSNLEIAEIAFFMIDKILHVEGSITTNYWN